MACFIKGHHHDRCAIALAEFGFGDKLFFAFLHADGVDDGFALNALKACFDHFPLGGVNHDGHAGDIGLAGNQVTETDHRRFGIEHAFIHVDVDNLGAVFNLL